ncbi:MAG: hypothetical protein ACYTGN_17830 [Planctomycetota bacterium]
MPIHLDPLLLIALAGALLGGLALGLDAARASVRRRLARGRRAEGPALRLLRRRGYRILATQPRATVRVTVDGEMRTYAVRADALARRRLRRYVVEVKTGAAASPAHPATRRQLAEYARAFRCRRLLLVDPGRGRIMRIDFG